MATGYQNDIKCLVAPPFPSESEGLLSRLPWVAYYVSQVTVLSQVIVKLFRLKDIRETIFIFLKTMIFPRFLVSNVNVVDVVLDQMMKVYKARFMNSGNSVQNFNGSLTFDY